MDPVSVIVAALAAGALVGVNEAATDAYQALKRQVRGRLGNRSDAELILTRHETDSDTWKAPLVKALTATDAGTDHLLLTAAQELLKLTDPAGTRLGKYVIDVRNSQGTIIGDNAHVTQHYGTTPST